MRLVIDIPDTLKKLVDENDLKTLSHAMWQSIMIDAIKNGTPLPVKHNGIVDLKLVKWEFDDAILEEAEKTGKVRATSDEIAKILSKVPTIISWTKSEEDE